MMRRFCCCWILEHVRVVLGGAEYGAAVEVPVGYAGEYLLESG